MPPGVERPEVDSAIKSWFQNIRPQGGFRLTRAGYDALVMLNIDCWSLDLERHRITKRDLLTLDHHLAYPYYIDSKNKSIVLFSSREAMMATLYGNIAVWLQSSG